MVFGGRVQAHAVDSDQADEKRKYDDEEHQTSHQGFAPAEQLAREASLTLFIFGLLQYDFLHQKDSIQYYYSDNTAYAQVKTKNGEQKLPVFVRL